MSESVVPASTAPATARETDAATRLVLAIHRLAKECEAQDDASASVNRFTEDALAAVHDYAADSGQEAPRLTFLRDAVFVGGSRLRSSRDMLATAMELGEMLAACDVGDVTFGARVPPESMRQFARLIQQAGKDAALRAQFTDGSLVGIRATKAPAREEKRAFIESAAKRSLRTYSVAVVTVREIHTEIRGGESASASRRLKRLAQALVSNVSDSPRVMMTLATLAVPADSATMSVATAIVGVAMSAQLTSDRHTLTNIAIAGLSFDAGRPRLEARGSFGAGASTESREEAALDDVARDRLPATTAAAMTGFMGLAPPAQARTAIVFEAHWMRRAARLGPLYRGERQGTIAARVLAVARGFVELRAAERAKPSSLERTLKRLRDRATDERERDAMALLTGALGLFPMGTLVELSSGERAIVLETPANALHVVQPRVRIITDAKGKDLPAPIERDLRESDAGTMRWVRRAVVAKVEHASVTPEDRPTPVVQPPGSMLSTSAISTNAPSDDLAAAMLASFPKSDPPPAPSVAPDRSAMDRLLAEFVADKKPAPPSSRDGRDSRPSSRVSTGDKGRERGREDPASGTVRRDLRAEDDGEPSPRAPEKVAASSVKAPTGVDDLLAKFIREEAEAKKSKRNER